MSVTAVNISELHSSFEVDKILIVKTYCNNSLPPLSLFYLFIYFLLGCCADIRAAVLVVTQRVMNVVQEKRALPRWWHRKLELLPCKC